MPVKTTTIATCDAHHCDELAVCKIKVFLMREPGDLFSVGEPKYVYACAEHAMIEVTENNEVWIRRRSEVSAGSEALNLKRLAKRDIERFREQWAELKEESILLPPVINFVDKLLNYIAQGKVSVD